MPQLLDPSDARLNLRSGELSVSELQSDGIRNLLSDMLSIAGGVRDKAHPNQRTTVGLSAPQLGKFIRVILVDLSADPESPSPEPNFKFFLNPLIILSSSSESMAREGCWSTGNICGAVLRPDEVTVSALDEKGKKFEFTSQNPFQSHIIQHEIDHLDGIRFPSRIRDPKYLHIVGKDEFQAYRENWRTWTKLCPIEDWLNIYMGGNTDANVSTK